MIKNDICIKIKELYECILQDMNSIDKEGLVIKINYLNNYYKTNCKKMHFIDRGDLSCYIEDLYKKLYFITDIDYKIKYDKCGIYMIINKINNELYIGQSKKINNRFKSHETLLINNKHYNNILQSSVNNYGIYNFEFCVLLECKVNHLNWMETEVIKFLRSNTSNMICNLNNGYNDSYKVR